MYKQFLQIAATAFLVMGQPIPASADESPTEFVRSLAAKTAFMADVGKIGFMAGEMFRFNTFGVMRMTHTNWKFPEDDLFLDKRNITYGYEIRSTAERTVYDAVQVERAIARNGSVSSEDKATAADMIDLLRRLYEQSKELGELYDAGDAAAAGDFFYSEIVPVYEAIRRGETTISFRIANEVRLAALRFKE